MFSNFFPQNLDVYGIMWTNEVEPNRPHTAIRRTRFACRISEATDTHSEYVILCAFPVHHRLREYALMLTVMRTLSVLLCVTANSTFSYRLIVKC
jgi:hypothetical protein